MIVIASIIACDTLNCSIVMDMNN